MGLVVSSQPIPLRTDEEGVLRVGATRVSLDSIVHNYKSGATVEQIADDFPTLELADIHAVISYYLRHHQEVESYLAEQQRQADELRREIEADPRNQMFRQRLVERTRRPGNNAPTDGR